MCARLFTLNLGLSHSPFAVGLSQSVVTLTCGPAEAMAASMAAQLAVDVGTGNTCDMDDEPTGTEPKKWMPKKTSRVVNWKLDAPILLRTKSSIELDSNTIKLEYVVGHVCAVQWVVPGD